MAYIVLFAIWLVPSILLTWLAWFLTRRLATPYRIAARSILLPFTIWPLPIGGGHGTAILPLCLAWPLFPTLRDSEFIYGFSITLFVVAVAITFLVQLLVYQIRRRSSQSPPAI